MLGKDKAICIAGKNECAINCLSYVISKYKKFKILALPNTSDVGIDGWQKSFKKFAKKKKIQIIKLKDLYTLKNLYLFSIEYEKILNIKKFNSNQLFNIHFSLLPKYRGCHTNFFQLFNGEKKTGVTLHRIDRGIDTGPIIDSLIFDIKKNTTAYENYIKLMKKSVTLFKKNFDKILNDNFNQKKQNLRKGSYYSRKSVDYKKIKIIKKLKNDLKTHNKIRSLIFQPFQLPVYNGRKIKMSLYKNKKIKLIYI